MLVPADWATMDVRWPVGGEAPEPVNATDSGFTTRVALESFLRGSGRR